MLHNYDQGKNWEKFIQKEDLNALSEVYFHYYDQLFTYGLKHSSNRQAVEDTIQNIFLNFIKYRKSIGQVKNLTGYLTSSFRRQLFLDLKNQKKTILSSQLPEEHFTYFTNPDQDISDKTDREEVQTLIKQCVSHLTAKQQEIIFLRFEQGISYEEISSMLNISVDSCYKLLYRSVQAIRSEVEKLLTKGGNLILFFRINMGK